MSMLRCLYIQVRLSGRQLYIQIWNSKPEMKMWYLQPGNCSKISKGRRLTEGKKKKTTRTEF